MMLDRLYRALTAGTDGGALVSEALVSEAVKENDSITKRLDALEFKMNTLIVLNVAVLVLVLRPLLI